MAVFVSKPTASPNEVRLPKDLTIIHIIRSTSGAEAATVTLTLDDTSTVRFEKKDGSRTRELKFPVQLDAQPAEFRHDIRLVAQPSPPGPGPGDEDPGIVDIADTVTGPPGPAETRIISVAILT